MPFHIALVALLLGTMTLAAQMPADVYEKRETRAATILATMRLHKLYDFSGTWYYAGPFDNSNRKGFDTIYPPEKKVDLKATYEGKHGARFGWKKFDGFTPGKIMDLKRFFPDATHESVVYIFHEYDAPQWQVQSLSLGSDDTLTVWANGERVLHKEAEHAAAPGQYFTEWKISPGKNTILLKVCQYEGEWAVYFAPEFPEAFSEVLRKRIDRDFPIETHSRNTLVNAENEAKYYRVMSIEPPKECVLEVGGLAMRSDGKLLACTRRGEIWIIDNPSSDKNHSFRLFAAGLHEPLGMHLETDQTLAVIQRPELTRITDRDKDDRADDFTTICDSWGVSGGYHEYAFGPARDKQGNYFISLNVGFSAGGQSPVPWRGWCVKVDPSGKMEPWASGLRSPNGINFSPEGDLFFCDNQGEWVATNNMHHIRKGKFYGHQASLDWMRYSPFKSFPSRIRSGMTYDGQAGPTGAMGMPDVNPPCIWFPYGRMGQSASEMRWDTTGKFGPFAGQCFVGDQTRACIMRVALEKVNGVYQGACFPFRGGLQCGVNRLLFGPDGSLFVGQTARGWGSIGGKPHGLQRINYTGRVPFEIKTMNITRHGFDLILTKPVNPRSITTSSFTLKSYTYYYHSNYGCPEIDPRGERIMNADLSPDGLRVSLTVPHLKPGRVFDLRAAGVRATSGEPLLHAEAYYTLNEIPK